jgi:hypothetical protein
LGIVSQSIEVVLSGETQQAEDAVQWPVALPIKILVVVIGSFAVSLDLYELFVLRINLVCASFGMKPRRT